MGFFDSTSPSYLPTYLTTSSFTSSDANRAPPLDNSDEYRHHDEMTNRPHEAKWSHELIGGAAAYEAMKAYEDHEARNGSPPPAGPPPELGTNL